MRKCRILLLTLLLAALFAGCTGAPAARYEVEKNGVTFTVDREAKTLSAVEQVYRYEMEGSRTTITYPNGATYWWVQDGMHGSGGWSDQYDPVLYIDGDILLDVLEAEQPQQPSGLGGWKYVAAVIFAGLGIFNIAAPRVSWQISYGWRYKDAEPSDLALAVGRVSGGIGIVVAVVLLFL